MTYRNFLISYNFKNRISRVQTFAIRSSSGTNFCEIGANSRKSRKFIHAKVSTSKVVKLRFYIIKSWVVKLRFYNIKSSENLWCHPPNPTVYLMRSLWTYDENAIKLYKILSLQVLLSFRTVVVRTINSLLHAARACKIFELSNTFIGMIDSMFFFARDVNTLLFRQVC